MPTARAAIIDKEGAAVPLEVRQPLRRLEEIGMKFTQTQIRCLLAILSLSRMAEGVASKDVAKLMGVSRPSVHKTLDILCCEGVVAKAPYGDIRITVEGQRSVEAMESDLESLFLLFSKEFGLAPDESNTAAVLMLSELKPESIRKLLEKR